MNVIFFGTPDFAVASLEKLLNHSVQVIAVVTSADKPSGRGLKIQHSAVKEFALKNNLKILQPVNLKDENFILELKNLNADLFIVVAFRMLPEQVWNMPPLGTYNLHASLLPKYRGAAPINWCIINGDNETGASTFKLQHQIDTGNILLSEKINLNEKITAGELHDELKHLGANLLLKSVCEIENSIKNNTPLKFIAQNQTLVSHAPKLTKENGKINWNQTANQVHNLIRGLSPYPTAYSFLENENGKKFLIKIFSSDVIEHETNMEVGSIVTDNKTFFNVVCGAESLSIKEIQAEGKKRMSIEEFLRGIKIHSSAKFILN